MNRTKLNDFIDYVYKINGRAANSECHGIWHWERVENFGLLMAEMCPEADKDVISWFAYVHDSMRSNDGFCFNHGPMAAELVDKVRGTYMSDLSDDQIETLKLACRKHTSDRTTDNVTANICMDADRLDLPRVWILPDPMKMASKYGKELAGVIAAEGEKNGMENLTVRSYGILQEYLMNKK